MRSVIILCAVLVIPQLCFGSDVGDIRIKLNGGADMVYTDQPNVLEIWIENDVDLNRASFAFEIYWDPMVTITWNMGHGNHPPVQEHGRAIGAWDRTNGVLKTHGFDNLSPDYIGITGMSQVVDFPAGRSELCYSLEFDAIAPPGVTTNGFCVQPCFDPVSHSWIFGEDGSSISSQPNFNGNVVIDPYAPKAPPLCFDVKATCGDVNDDTSIDALDLAYLIQYMFNDGPAPIGDADMDECGSVNIGDVWYLIQYMFMAGPPPCGGSVTCTSPTGGNSIDLGCPVMIYEANGDSVAIPVYITNDTQISALSLGFNHNSADVEITSVSFAGSVLSTDFVRDFSVDPTNNEVVIYWACFSGKLFPQTGGLLATMWAQVPVSTYNQSVDLDSAFLGPATEFVFCPSSGGVLTPAYNDCGAAEIVILVSPPAACGDVNCDGTCNVSDAVAIINYVFVGGNNPCDTDGDGIPDC